MQGELFTACRTTSGTKLSRHTGLTRSTGTKLSRHAPKRRFRPTLRQQGEFCTASTTTKPSRANFFAHKTQHNGDAETDNTSSTEKRAKNTRFSPAKATPVSTSHGHKLAKATGVSKNRTAWSTGPGRGAGGRRQGQGGNTRTTGTPDWRSPRGLRGLAGLRDDAPSEARGADGSRAGRPRGGRKSGGAKQRRRSGGAAHGHTQRPGPTARPDGARNIDGATSTAAGNGKPTAPGTP